MAAKFLNNDEIQGNIKDNEKVLRVNADLVILETRRVFKRYLNAVKAALLDGAKESEIVKAAELANLTRDLNDYLIEAGMPELLEEYQSTLAKIGKQSLVYFERLTGEAQKLGGISADTLNGLSRNFITDYGIKMQQALIIPVEREIRRSFITYENRADAVKNVAKAINDGNIVRKDGREFTNANIENLIADTQRQFQQAVVSEKAKELGLDIFLYSGVLDAFNSPQCRAILLGRPHGASGMYYRSEITEKLHPNLKGNPLITRGHPGCRHQWIPVTLEYAKTQGFKP